MQEIDFNVKHPNLYEAIAEKLETMILSDSSQLEQKLPSEQFLAASFGVSRPVIREALMLLKARGLITQRNGEGSFISTPDPRELTNTLNRIILLNNMDITSVFEIRVTLEIMAARLVAERASHDEIQTLTLINDEMEQLKHDLKKRVDLDIQFHTKLAELSGNSLLGNFVMSMTSLLEAMMTKSITVNGTNEEGIQYHRKIIEALRSGDPERAEDTVRGHLVSSMRNYEIASRLSP
ncbi:FadR/GntR family transcriptional regulator [Paenibacillus cymbidii]|uniref:FadR/GntR family transcriptional regulator n=1 Tax=Paenibacillus cymbidii TaxID=1639034 RepID=UPI001081D9A0|nr:FadR/GntR family transcriptional regulator [Paenibacillus cymbidii]